MFKFMKSTHEQYADRVQKAKTRENQHDIAVEYFRKKLNGRKIPCNADKSNPVIIDLNSKLETLKKSLKPGYHIVVTEAYSKVLNDAYEMPLKKTEDTFQTSHLLESKTDQIPHELPISKEAWEKLQDVGCKFEIPNQALIDLAINLTNRDIRFVIDDSKSMNEKDEITRGGKPCTRWEALGERVGIAAAIASCLDKDGLNLYFLNTEPKIVRNLMTAEDVINEFKKRIPVDYTPLRVAIETALNDGKEDKPLLIEIATDGMPTDITPPGFTPNPKDIVQTPEGPCYIDYDVQPRLERVLQTRTPVGANKPPKSDVCFGVMLCNRGGEVAWWNELDGKIDRLDVNICYQDEAKEVQRKTGKHFTFGEYLAKVLLGPVKDEYDHQDEINPPLKLKR